MDLLKTVDPSRFRGRDEVTLDGERVCDSLGEVVDGPRGYPRFL